MIKTWEDLKYWDTGEFQCIQEFLDDLDKAKLRYCPARENIFAPLYETDFDKVKVVFVGQDPYPNARYASGLAFSIPKGEKEFPPTLREIFNEYQSDLHLPPPSSGDLMDWAKEGVLLWNVVPTCEEGHSLSHNWIEWYYLTEEIFTELVEKTRIVFVFFGSFAAKYARLIPDDGRNTVICVGHPSPLARLNKSAKNPFTGSHVFTRTNAALVEFGHDPINWKLSP